MEINEIIECLNKMENIAHINFNNIEQAGLTAEEKVFIKKFQPEKVLIIYGTLAPGKPNHHLVEHIKGKWQHGIVRGKLMKEGWGTIIGYDGFVHTSLEEQEEIPAFILSSDELIANWPTLDEFEGDGYQRILAMFELNNGEIGVGYIYAVYE
ncbi:MAG: gamma-glutamylcyclotransferase [Ferruginibacter sp.]